MREASETEDEIEGEKEGGDNKVENAKCDNTSVYARHPSDQVDPGYDNF